MTPPEFWNLYDVVCGPEKAFQPMDRETLNELMELMPDE